MISNIFPDFYFIIFFCLVSFALGYISAFYTKQSSPSNLVSTPKSSEEQEGTTPAPNLKEDAKIKQIPPVTSTLEGDKSKDDGYLDLREIVPGQIRAVKTYDRRQSYKKSSDKK